MKITWSCIWEQITKLIISNSNLARAHIVAEHSYFIHYSLAGAHVHPIIHGYLGPYESTAQTASSLVQLRLQGLQVW